MKNQTVRILCFVTYAVLMFIAFEARYIVKFLTPRDHHYDGFDHRRASKTGTWMIEGVGEYKIGKIYEGTNLILAKDGSNFTFSGDYTNLPPFDHIRIRADSQKRIYSAILYSSEKSVNTNFIHRLEDKYECLERLKSQDHITYFEENRSVSLWTASFVSLNYRERDLQKQAEESQPND